MRHWVLFTRRFLRDEVVHECHNEYRLSYDCVGKLCIPVAAREAIVEKEVDFIKCFEEFIFGKHFFKAYHEVGENASDNCC